MITPVSIATTATQTETEVFNSNIAATQTEAEEVNVRALLDKTEERLGEHINQVSSGILAQLMPLLHNIQQQINDLRQDSLSLITPAQSVPLSPERPVAKQKGGLSAWRKVKNVVQWTPFIQTRDKTQNYPWVQLAGHSGR